jgi:hypothetical protein
MIKRKYFLHIRKNLTDGSGSYSFSNIITTKTSWFPVERESVSEEALALSKELLGDDETSIFEITAFNRI